MTLKMIQEDEVYSTMHANIMNSGTCGTFAQNNKKRKIITHCQIRSKSNRQNVATESQDISIKEI